MKMVILFCLIFKKFYYFKKKFMNNKTTMEAYFSIENTYDTIQNSEDDINAKIKCLKCWLRIYNITPDYEIEMPKVKITQVKNILGFIPHLDVNYYTLYSTLYTNYQQSKVLYDDLKQTYYVDITFKLKSDFIRKLGESLFYNRCDKLKLSFVSNILVKDDFMYNVVIDTVKSKSENILNLIPSFERLSLEEDENSLFEADEVRRIINYHNQKPHCTNRNVEKMLNKGKSLSEILDNF